MITQIKSGIFEGDDVFKVDVTVGTPPAAVGYVLSGSDAAWVLDSYSHINRQFDVAKSRYYRDMGELEDSVKALIDKAIIDDRRDEEE
jgi:hypothetical protein